MLAEAMGGDLSYERVDGTSVITFSLRLAADVVDPETEAA